MGPQLKAEVNCYSENIIRKEEPGKREPLGVDKGLPSPAQDDAEHNKNFNI